MIYLGKQNNDNCFVVTLYEKCCNQVNPYFTWKLTNRDTKISYIFYLPDLSNSAYYYNRFKIDCLSAGSNYYLNAPLGQYIYEVYEMEFANDLDLDNAIGLVENGILNIT